ncbi:MAG: hypothetical protein AAFN93_19225, partial [Bacteroidota bacterium]
ILGVIGGSVYALNRSKLDQHTFGAVVKQEDTITEGFNCDGVHYDKDMSYLLEIDEPAAIRVNAAHITPKIIINDSVCIQSIRKMFPGKYKYSIGWEIDDSYEGIVETELQATKNIDLKSFPEESEIQALDIKDGTQFGMTSGGSDKEDIENSESCSRIKNLDSFSYSAENYTTIQIPPNDRFKFQIIDNLPYEGDYLLLAQNLEDNSFTCGNTLDYEKAALSLSEGNYKLWAAYDSQPNLHLIETTPISFVGRQDILQSTSALDNNLRCHNKSLEGEPESVLLPEGDFKIWIGEVNKPSDVFITQRNSRGEVSEDRGRSGGDELLSSIEQCEYVSYEEDNNREVKVDDELLFHVDPDGKLSDIAIIYQLLE